MRDSYHGYGKPDRDCHAEQEGEMTNQQKARITRIDEGCHEAVDLCTCRLDQPVNEEWDEDHA